MPLLLARVDDRLIHGQVAHGWGRRLEATLYAVVSDELRGDPERSELYLLPVPDGARGVVLSVDEAAGAPFREDVARERALVLFADLATPLRLAEAGFPLTSLNVGGIHDAPGRTAVLPYVFLGTSDRDAIRSLVERGVHVVAQDLPSNPSHDLADLLGRA